MKQTILIVDDEPDLVELTGYHLRAAGFKTLTAFDGSEALNQARSHLPDLILLDLMLPELDGLSVCELLHRLPSTRQIPIIIVSAWKNEQSRLLGLELGAEDYISKPFSPRELVLRVQKVLHRRTELVVTHSQV